MEIIQIVIIGLCGVIFIAIFDKQKEFGVYISIAVVVIIFFAFINQMDVIINLLNKIKNIINLQDIYMKILLQILGIAFVTEFGAQLCKDSGQKAIANNIELAGKIIILVIAAPIILAIINLVESFV